MRELANALPQGREELGGHGTGIGRGEGRLDRLSGLTEIAIKY